MLKELKQDLRSVAEPERIPILSNFFKTGKGQYGEGDKFLGITVPNQRKVAKKYREIPLRELEKLLQSPYHEERLTSLLILVEKYKREQKKEQIDFFLRNAKGVNNWDLVDLTAPKVLGHWLLDKERKILYTLAKSTNLWEKRIAIIATLTFIQHKEYKDTLAIAEILMQDKHDLIHKAIGWMLREIGKRNREVETTFLEKHAATMPRTALRYALEHYEKEQRKYFMGMKAHTR